MAEIPYDPPPPYSSLGYENSVCHGASNGVQIPMIKVYAPDDADLEQTVTEQMSTPLTGPGVSPDIAASEITHGISRFTCAMCGQVILFKPRGIARCPCCMKLSAVGQTTARNRTLACGIIGFVFLTAAIGTLIRTFHNDELRRYYGIDIVWAGSFFLAVVFFVYSFRYAILKTSPPVNEQIAQ